MNELLGDIMDSEGTSSGVEDVTPPQYLTAAGRSTSQNNAIPKRDIPVVMIPSDSDTTEDELHQIPSFPRNSYTSSPPPPIQRRSTSPPANNRGDLSEDSNDDATQAPLRNKLSIHAIPVIPIPVLSQGSPPPAQSEPESSPSYLRPQFVGLRDEYDETEEAEDGQGHAPPFPSLIPETPETSHRKRRRPINDPSEEESLRILESPFKLSQSEISRLSQEDAGFVLAPETLAPSLSQLTQASSETSQTSQTSHTTIGSQEEGMALRRKVVEMETQGSFSVLAFSFPLPPDWESLPPDDLSSGRNDSGDEDEDETCLEN